MSKRPNELRTPTAAVDGAEGRISAIENCGDLYVATLRRYVESLGGALELAVVKDGERILLSL